ncbi:MAG: tetraacyldisaccharide 4'-kinase [Candidatus Cloacimonetes bacterium]|nr:tetraacyldisaccharide 4'-kinase [Candidatus Cloacimonadota bacterium]MDY0173134.1 tetraacyldisaccharide 4'-kinase [Candidatus Cloacimonadaceae bacterium]
MKHNSFVPKHLLNRSWLSYSLYPASLIYAGYMRWRRKYLFQQSYRPPYKVISIGNLSLGGSGKSPIAMALAKELSEHNLSIAYSSRGYKSMLENSATLIYDGHRLLATPNVAGDEAVMAAVQLDDVPVFSGKLRKAVMQLAEKLYPNLDIMILDDAFQHLKVARDIDIVVFDTELGLGNGFVLPAGYLREGLSAISPESICLLHQKPWGKKNPELKAQLSATGAKVYEVKSQSGKILHKGKSIAVEALKDKKITLLCAIAHPESFVKSAQMLGIPYQKQLIFPDHHSFTDAKSLALLEADDSDYLLCTTKDFVKLSQDFRDKLLVLTMETSLPQDLLEEILGRLKAKN